MPRPLRQGKKVGPISGVDAVRREKFLRLAGIEQVVPSVASHLTNWAVRAVYIYTKMHTHTYIHTYLVLKFIGSTPFNIYIVAMLCQKLQLCSAYSSLKGNEYKLKHETPSARNYILFSFFLKTVVWRRLHNKINSQQFPKHSYANQQQPSSHTAFIPRVAKVAGFDSRPGCWTFFSPHLSDRLWSSPNFLSRGCRGLFRLGKISRSEKLKPDLNVISRLRIRGVLPPRSLYIVIALCLNTEISLSTAVIPDTWMESQTRVGLFERTRTRRVGSQFSSPGDHGSLDQRRVTIISYGASHGE